MVQTEKVLKKTGEGRKAWIGIGVVLAVTTAAYFLFGERVKKKYKILKDWAVKRKQDFLRR